MRVQALFLYNPKFYLFLQGPMKHKNLHLYLKDFLRKTEGIRPKPDGEEKEKPKKQQKPKEEVKGALIHTLDKDGAMLRQKVPTSNMLARIIL